ncbi:HAMP domain-containing histidine kinase [Bacteroidales bacterium OttesenSCG-928-B11]|nr:HAMP domain-containing histidine kinase [Bacteroidales bacterium OttesenSCG-928-C03]MDL2313076.1 HAMP domain-containing histidine kinase [Bacteroidales bacterium OttesenSCG-928-B11]
MKVKTRLSLFCSLAFGIVFAVISVLIYGLYYRNVERTIYRDLEKTARISALFYLEEDELSTSEFDKIRAQFEEIVSESAYVIYNLKNEAAYGTQTFDVPLSVLEKIRQSNRHAFATSEYLCYGIFYVDNQGDFVVIAKENKELLTEQASRLLWILFPLFLVGVVVIILLSRWVAQIAYRPFSKTITEVNNISTNNLDIQIKSPQTNDELQDLIDTFNNLLAKISETVVIQKNFVRYVSHEFKTPLASMLGNLDVFSIKDRSPEEYHQLSEKLMRQIFQMEEILDTLIVVSDLRKDEKEIMQTRIDELIWTIINKLKDIYPSSKILVNIDISPEDESLMLVDVEHTQLLIALFNLIENAVKYSEKDNVEISLRKEVDSLCLTITDKGIGIPREQLLHISKPFYRADNTNTIQGSGIGLSLALRILDRNKVRYHIDSEEKKGTIVTIIF